MCRIAVAGYAAKAKVDRILPFQFVAAARAVPEWEGVIEPMMLRCLEGQKKLPGKTVLVIDTSGSMHARLSAKSELNRKDVAAALAILVREVCEEAAIYCTAGDDGTRVHATMPVPPRRDRAVGLHHRAGSGVQDRRGRYLPRAVHDVRPRPREGRRPDHRPDRRAGLRHEAEAGVGGRLREAELPRQRREGARNGIGYRKWLHIDGWSDKVMAYIEKYEASTSE